jgi:hypothetical protein
MESDDAVACPTCGRRQESNDEAPLELGGDFETGVGLEAAAGLSLAEVMGEAGASFEAGPAASPFALVRAIPDNPDPYSVIPLDYRLSAKAIVGALPGDLQRLEPPRAKDVGDFMKGTYKLLTKGEGGVFFDILVGALKNIPGGYLAQAADVADDWAARGFARGVVSGAAIPPKSRAFMVRAFGHERIPSWGKIGAANYIAGLTAGHMQGQALSNNQRQIFWKDLAARAPDLATRVRASSNWSDKAWQDWFRDVAVQFRRYHLDK